MIEASARPGVSRQRLSQLRHLVADLLPQDGSAAA